MADRRDPATVRARVGADVVGRERELELVTAAIAARRDLLLEGPPGTSKTTLLRAIASSWGRPFVLVEGNADLTPSKLLGHHDPAQVLREGYRDENFVDGPLLRAMRQGGFLYLEELNRAPDDTLNTMLTTMAEREVTVPRLGRVVAEPSFRVIASMNPYDNVGTTRLSTSIHDRFNRLRIGYQDADAERRIVAVRAPLDTGSIPASLAATLRSDAVMLTRATRDDPEVRQGSSVRGAIDLTLVAAELLAGRGITCAGGAGRRASSGARGRPYALAIRDAMELALSGRIHLDEAADTTPEAVLQRLWEDHFLLDPAASGSVEGVAVVGAETPVTRTGRDERQRPERRRRQPKQLDEEPTLYTSSGGGAGPLVRASPGSRGPGPGRTEPGTTAPGSTDEPAEQLDRAPEGEGSDGETLRRAREIAARLAVPRPPREASRRRGRGELVSVPYRGTSDELDLDATLDVLVQEPVPTADDIVVRERLRTRRSVVLAVDVSGSMRGERVRTAAATVGALVSELARDDLAVLAFWADAAMLAELGQEIATESILESLIRIPARGLTNLTFPLQLAREQLARVETTDARLLLLSDCVHNAGPDPRTVAASLPRLDVLLDTSGEKDVDLARELTHLGRGRLELVGGYRDVAPALSRLLAT